MKTLCIIAFLVLSVAVCAEGTPSSANSGKASDKNSGKQSGKEYTFRFRNKEYRIVKQKMTWSQAMAVAKKAGGTLASIRSQEEQDTIMRAIMGGAKIPQDYSSVADGGGTAYIWLGATDKYKEGTWIWDNPNPKLQETFWIGEGSAGKGGGAPVKGKYNNWGGASMGRANEPDNYGGAQNSGAIALAGWPQGGTFRLGQAGEWNDINANNKLYFIIEIELK
jgi:hypothetical protein